MGKPGLALPHIEPLRDFAAFRPALNDVIIEGVFLGVGFLDVFGHPIGHLAIGHRVLDDANHIVGGNAGGFEPRAVEAFGEILLVIGVKFSGDVQANFIDEPRQIYPAAHRFPRTAGMDGFVAHGRIIGVRGGRVNLV